jgi:hypothetical protein
MRHKNKNNKLPFLCNSPIIIDKFSTHKNQKSSWFFQESWHLNDENKKKKILFYYKPFKSLLLTSCILGFLRPNFSPFSTLSLQKKKKKLDPNNARQTSRVLKKKKPFQPPQPPPPPKIPSNCFFFFFNPCIFTFGGIWVHGV